MADADGFDVNDPFKLPPLNEELRPLDLALVYFTVSSRKPRPPPGQQGNTWGGAASASGSKGDSYFSASLELDSVDFNLFGAVKLASRADA